MRNTTHGHIQLEYLVIVEPEALAGQVLPGFPECKRHQPDGRRAIRLCKPPLLLMMCLIIHDAADPQRTSFNLGWRDAQVFHQCANVDRKADRGVCIQGNSSTNNQVLPGGLAL